MRRRKYLPAIGAAALLLAALAAGLLFWGRRPFRGLEAADIASASVALMPPDVTLELDETEMGTLASCWGRCASPGRTSPGRSTRGRPFQFTVTFADGNRDGGDGLQSVSHHRRHGVPHRL